MIHIIAVLALVSGALARDTFIVGGDDVDIANYPWQGSYRTGSGSHSCGCVFVGGDQVLTAGHCGGSSSYSMEFGGTDRGDGIVFDVSALVQHPDYGVGAGFTPNDISIVTATETISGNNISPATIHTSDSNPGGKGWITGWGRTCGSCSLPVTLQGAELDIISDDLCVELRDPSFQAENMICVWDETDQLLGACNGDSGGPLTAGSTLYGLTSWGSSGCGTNLPSVYTRVGAFYSWICDESGGAVEGC